MSLLLPNGQPIPKPPEPPESAFRPMYTVGRNSFMRKWKDRTRPMDIYRAGATNWIVTRKTYSEKLWHDWETLVMNLVRKTGNYA